MDIQELINIIKQAGDIILEYRNTKLNIDIKEDGGKVTKVDKEANEIIQNYLKENFPEYGIMSEELEQTFKKYTWYIDPLNGTNAYLDGTDKFNILVGLVKDNRPILGIIYHPTDGRLYIGGKDETPRMIYDGKEKLLSKSEYKKENLLYVPSDNWEKVFKELFKDHNEYKFIYNNTLDGDFEDSRIQIIDGKYNLQINSNFGKWGTWDVCAGHAILSYFNGAITDYYGKNIDYSKPKLNNGFITSDSIFRIKFLPWIKQ